VHDPFGTGPSDAALWKAAFLSEAAAFEKLKVMSFLHTREELEADGITGRPIPIKVVATVKKHPDGRYDRHKIRLVMCGHPAYCQRGTHYFETYSYSPETNLIRTVMAMAIVMGWDNRVWDISTFYLHADRSKCLRLPLRLPKGLRILDEFGNELLACLWSVLYSCTDHPALDSQHSKRSWQATG
jgi:hypothetical protein